MTLHDGRTATPVHTRADPADRARGEEQGQPLADLGSARAVPGVHAGPLLLDAGVRVPAQRVRARCCPGRSPSSNFEVVWNDLGFAIFFQNSLMVGVASLFMTTVIALAGGYALARYDFRGKKLFMMAMLCTPVHPRRHDADPAVRDLP